MPRKAADTQDARDAARYARLLGLLRQARKEAAMTQVEAAQALGKPQSYISKCEAGERRIDVVELERFAKVYGKPLAFFLEDP